MKSHLPANFPFEIVAGGHDTQIDTLLADFPIASAISQEPMPKNTLLTIPPVLHSLNSSSLLPVKYFARI